MTLCTAVLLATVLLTGAAGARVHRARIHRASDTCSKTGRPAASMSVGDVRTALLCLVNRERGARGLPALRESAALNRSAQEWTDHMVKTGEFDHGADFAGRMSAAGYRWQAAAENIATGQETPRAVVATWMSDLYHCQSILSPEYRDVGTGETPHPVPGVATQPATWTQDFGLAEGSRPPSHDTGPANGCPY